MRVRIRPISKEAKEKLRNEANPKKLSWKERVIRKVHFKFILDDDGSLIIDSKMMEHVKEDVIFHQYEQSMLPLQKDVDYVIEVEY